MNLMPWNKVADIAAHEAPSRNAVMRFKAALEKGGVAASVRRARGFRAEAACGMLAGVWRRRLNTSG